MPYLGASALQFGPLGWQHYRVLAGKAKKNLRYPKEVIKMWTRRAMVEVGFENGMSFSFRSLKTFKNIKKIRQFGANQR